MLHRALAAVVATSCLAGCVPVTITPAMTVPTFPTPVPVTTAPAAPATTTQKVLAGICTAANSVSGFAWLFPQSLQPAYSYLSETCANPPKDVASWLANAQLALSSLQTFLKSTAAAKGARYGASASIDPAAVRAALADVSSALVTVRNARSQAARHHGVRHHGR